MRGTTVTGTLLLATLFHDFLCTHYNVISLNLQINCDGCVTAFKLCHALSWIKGGLIIERNNEVRDKLLYLSRQAFTSESVCAQPWIHQGDTISEREICQGNDEDKNTRGDMMIQGLWYWYTCPIIDIKTGNADVDSYKYEPMKAILARWVTINKYKQSKHFHN